MHLLRKILPSTIPLNAISEEVFDKASYKKNILSKCCIIPASGFFEWMHVQKDKYPFVISVSEEMFSFAGIYNQWKDKTGEIKNTSPSLPHLLIH